MSILAVGNIHFYMKGAEVCTMPPNTICCKHGYLKKIVCGAHCTVIFRLRSSVQDSEYATGGVSLDVDFVYSCYIYNKSK